MVQNLEFHGVHTEINEQLKQYLTRKIGNLDKYVSPAARRSLHVEIFVKESKTHAPKRFECEAVAHLPKEMIRIKAEAMSHNAAVDMVEAKLKQALIKYKDTHGNPKRWRHMFKRAHSK